MTKTAHVPYAEIALAEDGTPISQAFGDVYFSREGGVAETQHVFLHGNALPERWCVGEAEPQSVGGDAPFKQNFVIAELGFGTGLNFLVAWQEFKRSGTGQLHYIAIEKFPLTPQQLTAALALHPRLAVEAAQFIDQYPARLPGWHRLQLGTVTLTLGFGDVEELLPQLTTKVDAWFLDGFAPAKNQAMWSDAVLAAIGAASAPDATFATFTAATAVRRGLETQGFSVKKVPGFGRKREMSIGKMEGGLAPPSPAKAVLPLPLRGSASPTHTSKIDPVIVIGGGIAGCSLARALAERGRMVTLLTRGVADGASGNAVGVLFPQLSKKWLPSTQWFFTGADFSRRRFAQLAQQHDEALMATPGILRLPRHVEEETALRNINTALGLDESIVQWVEADMASSMAGLALQTGAAWLKQGSWVAPARACHALLQHPNITVRTGAQVQALTRDTQGWCMELDDAQLYRSAHVCVVNAHEATRLLPQKLPMSVTAGQVSLLHAHAVSASLNMVLCHKGYVVPQGDTVLIGATYDRMDLSGAVTEENHSLNLAELEKFLPGFVQDEPYAGRTSIRATTPDRLPYVGVLEKGLWVSLGHGSRGMISAPLAAEIITSDICGEASPVGPELRRVVGPQRMIK